MSGAAACGLGFGWEDVYKRQLLCRRENPPSAAHPILLFSRRPYRYFFSIPLGAAFFEGVRANFCFAAKKCKNPSTFSEKSVIVKRNIDRPVKCRLALEVRMFERSGLFETNSSFL